MSNRTLIGIDCITKVEFEITEDQKQWITRNIFEKFIGTRDVPFNVFENEIFDIDERTKILKIIFYEYIVFCVLLNDFYEEDVEQNDWNLINWTSLVPISKILMHYINGLFNPIQYFPSEEMIRDCENCKIDKVCLSKAIIDVINFKSK